MNCSIELIRDTDPNNRPIVLVRGPGGYKPATSMAIIASEELVILPFLEGVGRTADAALFELDLPECEEPRIYRFSARTADGYPLGEEVMIRIDGLAAALEANSTN